MSDQNQSPVGKSREPGVWVIFYVTKDSQVAFVEKVEKKSAAAFVNDITALGGEIRAVYKGAKRVNVKVKMSL